MMVRMCHYMMQPLLVFARPPLLFQRHFAWKLHRERSRSFLNTLPRSLKFLDIWVSGHASKINVVFEALDGKQVVAYPFRDLEQAEKLMYALEEYIQVYMQDAFCFLGFDRTDSCICAACRASGPRNDTALLDRREDRLEDRRHESERLPDDTKAGASGGEGGGDTAVRGAGGCSAICCSNASTRVSVLISRSRLHTRVCLPQ